MSDAPDLPTWAISMWEDLGSPQLEGLQPIIFGDLLERRTGLRRDDLIEVTLDARALTKSQEQMMRGRLISSGKSSIEILVEDGSCHFLARDVIVEIKLIAHTRPAYIDDEELLSFEREDQKRRNELHEKVEKETGRDDGHIWG